MPQWAIVQVRFTLTAQEMKRVRKLHLRRKESQAAFKYTVFSVFEWSPGVFAASMRFFKQVRTQQLRASM